MHEGPSGPFVCLLCGTKIFSCCPTQIWSTVDLESSMLHGAKVLGNGMKHLACGWQPPQQQIL